MEAAPPGFVSAACVWMIAPRHYRYVLPRLHVPKPLVARPLLVPAAMRFDISLASWRFNGRAAEAGVFALAALGQLPSGAEALHFSVRVEAAEDRSCSFETHWGPGTKPYTCALPTPPVIDLQNCEMEYDFNAVVRLGHIKVHSDVPMAVVEELRADFSELDYNCFNKNCLTYAMELLKRLAPELYRKISSGFEISNLV